MKRRYIVSMLVCLMVNCAVPAEAGRIKRDLVFSDESPAGGFSSFKKSLGSEQKKAVVAVKATIEVNRDGKTSFITPDSIFEFEAGDKVRIFYTTNIDCYVYWMSKGTSGQYYMLFPTAKSGLNNFVKKNQENMIPFTGTFIFDQNPGIERIILTMSPEKIPAMESASSNAIVKDGRYEATNTEKIGTLLASNDSRRRSRDLIFEVQSDKGTGISTYSQTAVDRKEPFVQNYDLKHK